MWTTPGAGMRFGIYAGVFALAAGFAGASAQSVIGEPDYTDACRHAPAGAACAVQKERAAAAYAEMNAALAQTPHNCARLKTARDRFERELDGWMKLEGARITCELEAAKKKVAELQGPDRPPASTAKKPNDPKDKDVFALPPGRMVSAGAAPDPFALDPSSQSSQARVSASPSPSGSQAPKADPFENYKRHDRESAEVAVNVRRPGEEWKIEREGVPVGVLRGGDVFDTGDASERLQMAGLEMEQQKLLREMQEREAARLAEQERREAAQRAEEARQEAAWRAEVAEFERQQEKERERQERAERAARNAQTANLLAGMLQSYVTQDAARRGVPPPAFTTPNIGSGGYAAAPRPGYSPGGQQAADPQRAACERQVSAAASRLSGVRLGAGVCQSSRDAVRIYSEVERAYAGCQQYYAADYQATVNARRQAEAAVASSCSAPLPPAPGGFGGSAGGSRSDPAPSTVPNCPAGQVYRPGSGCGANDVRGGR